MFHLDIRSAVAQSVEHLKGPRLVQLYSTDVGSNPGRGLGVRIDCRYKIPSHTIYEH